MQLKMLSVAVFAFGEIAKASASGSKVICCDISSDGKLLATGGHDKKVSSSAQGSDLILPVVLWEKKRRPSILITHITYSYSAQAVLWSTEPLEHKSSLEEHSMLITDVRFSPSMPQRLATSSFDRTLRVWDAADVCISLFSTFRP